MTLGMSRLSYFFCPLQRIIRLSLAPRPSTVQLQRSFSKPTEDILVWALACSWAKLVVFLEIATTNLGDDSFPPLAARQTRLRLYFEPWFEEIPAQTRFEQLRLQNLVPFWFVTIDVFLYLEPLAG